MFPHHPEFPHRRRVLLLAVATGALAALVWPGLDLGRRIAAPCAVILSCAMTYGFVLGMLKALSHLPRIVFMAYSHTFFYGGILAVVFYPFFVADVLNDPAGLSQFQKVLWLCGAIPISFAAAAGAYVAIDAERNAV